MKLYRFCAGDAGKKARWYCQGECKVIQVTETQILLQMTNYKTMVSKTAFRLGEYKLHRDDGSQIMFGKIPTKKQIEEAIGYKVRVPKEYLQDDEKSTNLSMRSKKAWETRRKKQHETSAETLLSSKTAAAEG